MANGPPPMLPFHICYLSAGGMNDLKDMQAAYWYVTEPGLVEFKNSDHKIVFCVPQDRLVYIEVDRDQAA
jgi:hypothetical protein